MRILGIETSCDETSVAVAEGELNSKIPLKIVSSVLASSADLHVKYGGILPEQAARQQVKVMIPVLWECLEKTLGGNSEANKEKIRRHGQGIEAIAITIGPGLVGSLLVGVETARTLAYFWQKPIIPVNHLVAHLYANFIETNHESRIKSQDELPQFPAIGLVVSGGHTDMVFLKGHKSLRLIGSTRDDAAGECFDKCARMLGLPYPGGPEIARLAEQWLGKNSKYDPSTSLRIGTRNPKLTLFPRPLADQETFDWSFSGLKTSVLYYLQKTHGGNISEVKRFGTVNSDREQLARVSAEIQEAVCDSLIIKLSRAIIRFQPKSVLIAGGVAANKRLAEKLSTLNKGSGWKLFVPSPKLCTDNGGYIAAYAFYHFSPTDWRKIKVDPGLTIMEKV